MSINIFKIYDGRNSFWQWDTGQKLIVLNEEVNEVHFSNKDMTHSTRSEVYELADGTRVCDVPNLILQLPRNLIAYAHVNDGGISKTIKSVKFAVRPRPIPDDYIMKTSAQMDEIARRLELLEDALKNVEMGNQTLHKFTSMVDAALWAKQNGEPGTIVVVKINGKWIAHIIEDDFSVTPICDSDGEMVEISLVDGGDGDGYADGEATQFWDGGSVNTVEQVSQFWDGGGAAGY